MKTFEVPEFYRSPLMTRVKEERKANDKLKKDFTPTCLDFGKLKFYLARHFGFCYGVENAIEIAFKTVSENKGKRIFLLSEMIHNPQVNKDLELAGVRFIMDTQGNSITPWEQITADDIVIVPAFGTTLIIEEQMKAKGLDPLRYNATCPFVERVWKKASQIAKEEYTIVVHGKPSHEETKATFSHSSSYAATIILKDMADAELLAKYITGTKDVQYFNEDFKGRTSENFDASKHLQRIGVVNQTTMLAEDTQAIAEYLKEEIKKHYQLDESNIETRFADTRDTLCYATNDNQTAVKGMLEQEADLAIIVGGYNSSNTSHLVELSEHKVPTYFIRDEHNLLSKDEIIRYHFRTHEEEVVQNYLPTKQNVKILISSGASCPDAIVEKVINKIAGYFGAKNVEPEIVFG
jgi:4-hydroxy-3-methylbut-2-en-1-yl diphosphate reductase